MNENKYNESVIVSITEWINNNLDQRLSVDDIAEKVTLSGIYRNFLPVIIMKPWRDIFVRKSLTPVFMI